ncbi:MAG: putative tRNA methyltransferase complex GCD14 [Streblomastix strix]|uniref:tRNA (adenine(58)-N(1))-methyltransferase n=1 Tax=Streblomastix strix TaxID=222440 RepID=A0A5J4WCD3_9EUKA|nr:MAG: putative tRNA methyltransferase complex GCD14 [Streblomastix strix]
MELVAEGDDVIVCEGPQRINLLTVQRGKTYQNRFGIFLHDDFVGVPYGTKVFTRKTKNFIHILRPTPELLAGCLRRRTQVLFQADISLILLHLDINPGKIVVESGTGSGVLSRSIIRSVAPTGHLFTFEFNRVRADAAREELSQGGMGIYVTVTHRDVVAEGLGMPQNTQFRPFQINTPKLQQSNLFPFSSQLSQSAAQASTQIAFSSLYQQSSSLNQSSHNEYCDAVFLDLPNPWDVVESAYNVLRSSTGLLCTFSPCIEQVQRNCSAMRRVGFEDIQTLECLVRNYEIKRFPNDFSNGSYEPIKSSKNSFKDQQMKKGKQSSQAQQIKIDGNSNKQKKEQSNINKDIDVDTVIQKEDENPLMQKKKRKREELDKEEENGDNKESDQSTHAFNTSTTPHVYAVPELNMRSHTGFLTFCPPNIRFFVGGAPDLRDKPLALIRNIHLIQSDSSFDTLIKEKCNLNSPERGLYFSGTTYSLGDYKISIGTVTLIPSSSKRGTILEVEYTLQSDPEQVGIYLDLFNRLLFEFPVQQNEILNLLLEEIEIEKTKSFLKDDENSLENQLFIQNTQLSSSFGIAPSFASLQSFPSSAQLVAAMGLNDNHKLGSPLSQRAILYAVFFASAHKDNSVWLREKRQQIALVEQERKAAQQLQIQKHQQKHLTKLFIEQQRQQQQYDIIVDVDESIRNENVSGTKRRRVDDENQLMYQIHNILKVHQEKKHPFNRMNLISSERASEASIAGAAGGADTIRILIPSRIARCNINRASIQEDEFVEGQL